MLWGGCGCCDGGRLCCSARIRMCFSARFFNRHLTGLEEKDLIPPVERFGSPGRRKKMENSVTIAQRRSHKLVGGQENLGGFHRSRQMRKCLPITTSCLFGRIGSDKRAHDPVHLWLHIQRTEIIRFDHSAELLVVLRTHPRLRGFYVTSEYPARIAWGPKGRREDRTRVIHRG